MRKEKLWQSLFTTSFIYPFISYFHFHKLLFWLHIYAHSFISSFIQLMLFIIYTSDRMQGPSSRETEQKHSPRLLRIFSVARETDTWMDNGKCHGGASHWGLWRSIAQQHPTRCGGIKDVMECMSLKWWSHVGQVREGEYPDKQHCG